MIRMLSTTCFTIFAELHAADKPIGRHQGAIPASVCFKNFTPDNRFNYRCDRRREREKCAHGAQRLNSQTQVHFQLRGAMSKEAVAIAIPPNNPPTQKSSPTHRAVPAKRRPESGRQIAWFD